MDYLLPIPEREKQEGIEKLIFKLSSFQDYTIVISYIQPGAHIDFFLDSEEQLGIILKGCLQINEPLKKQDIFALKQVYYFSPQTELIAVNQTDKVVITIMVAKRQNENCVKQHKCFIDADCIIMPQIKRAFNFFTTDSFELIYSKIHASGTLKEETRIEIVLNDIPLFQIETNSEDNASFQKEIYYSSLIYRKGTFYRKKISINF